MMNIPIKPDSNCALLLGNLKNRRSFIEPLPRARSARPLPEGGRGTMFLPHKAAFFFSFFQHLPQRQENGKTQSHEILHAYRTNPISQNEGCAVLPFS